MQQNNLPVRIKIEFIEFLDAFMEAYAAFLIRQSSSIIGTKIITRKSAFLVNSIDRIDSTLFYNLDLNRPFKTELDELKRLMTNIMCGLDLEAVCFKKVIEIYDTLKRSKSNYFRSEDIVVLSYELRETILNFKPVIIEPPKKITLFERIAKELKKFD
jgi:hypothetical protein